MKWPRLVVILTVLNFVLLIVLIAQLGPVTAASVAPALRGRALELVDDNGRVRAEIKVFPAEPNLKMHDGTNRFSGSRAVAADRFDRESTRQTRYGRGWLRTRARRAGRLPAVPLAWLKELH